MTAGGLDSFLMRNLKINEHAFVEVTIDDVEWRIVQMRDKKTIKYYSKIGFKYVERENPDIGIKHMWTLLNNDSQGPEQ